LEEVDKPMADLSFILQAVTADNHANFIRALLKLPKPKQILVSVAFARTAGLEAIRADLSHLATKARFFVGIRNDITSLQAITLLLSLKIDVYAVDTGSRNIIFHPKLYLAANATNAIAIIGSANMTFNGLHNNIEVSTRMALDLAASPSDKLFVDSAVGAFSLMLAQHPKHVFKITGEKHAQQLFDEGRLADEDVILAPNTGSRISKGVRDNLSPMKLVRVNRVYRRTVLKKVAHPNVPPVPASSLKTVKYLVWESKPLSQRDLSIPRGTNTNPTGSMGLKKGLYDHIDQRHYFYDEVFSTLNWTPDSPGSRTLRTTGKFELIVKNVSYGMFDLVLSHKTDTQSRSYQQSNFMTQLHWGSARTFIAKDDLLGRNLYLYRKDSVPPEFTIEID
jgi:hypothetical protein